MPADRAIMDLLGMPSRAIRPGLPARCWFMAILAIAVVLFARPAQAGFLSELPGDVTNFAVLDAGSGSVKVNLTAYDITGDVGIGAPSGSTRTTFAPAGGCSGPCNLYGGVQFAGAVKDALSGNNNITGTITGGNANVQTDLNAANALSANLGAEAGKSATISLNSGQSAALNASDGTLDANGNRVFHLTSFSFQNGSTLTINGDAAGDSVVLDFSAAVQLGGTIKLAGLTPDQVLFNVTGNHALRANTNGATLAGMFLDPIGVMSFSNTVVDGRIIGGGSRAMNLALGITVDAPTPAPEPASFAILLPGLCVLGILRRKTRRPAGTG